MSLELDDGGAAFPQTATDSGIDSFLEIKRDVIPLRDWLAGQALAAIGSEYNAFGDITPHAKRHAIVIALHAYNIADAMLAARLTKPE